MCDIYQYLTGFRVLVVALNLGNDITFAAFRSRGSKCVSHSLFIKFIMFLEHIVPLCLGLL